MEIKAKNIIIVSPPRTGSTVMMTVLDEILSNHTLLGKALSACSTPAEENTICKEIYNQYVLNGKKFILVTNSTVFQRIYNDSANRLFFDLPIEYMTTVRDSVFEVALSIAVCELTGKWHTLQKNQDLKPIHIPIDKFKNYVNQVEFYFHLQNEMIVDDFYNHVFDYNDINKQSNTQLLHWVAERINIPLMPQTKYIHDNTKSKYALRQRVENFEQLQLYYQGAKNNEFTPNQ